MPDVRLIYPDRICNLNVNSISYAYGKKPVVLGDSNFCQIIQIILTYLNINDYADTGKNAHDTYYKILAEFSMYHHKPNLRFR